MSEIILINGSCADMVVDAVVNAANSGLCAGGGICGVIFNKAGRKELTAACGEYNTPLTDGSAVITPAFNMKNAKVIIHAVGPNFNITPLAFEELFSAYYNSLIVLKENNYHSISFPLISSSIFGGDLPNPVAESTKQCCKAYKRFIEEYPDYDIRVLLCAYTRKELFEAAEEYNKQFKIVINDRIKKTMIDKGFTEEYINSFDDSEMDILTCGILSVLTEENLSLGDEYVDILLSILKEKYEKKCKREKIQEEKEKLLGIINHYLEIGDMEQFSKLAEKYVLLDYDN